MTPPSPLPFADPASKLAEIWQRRLPQTLQRLEQLDRAASAAATGTLTAAQQAEAAATAHTFAGSLGMFGYQQATDLARELDQLWSSSSPHPADLADLTIRLRQSIFPEPTL